MCADEPLQSLDAERPPRRGRCGRAAGARALLALSGLGALLAAGAGCEFATPDCDLTHEYQDLRIPGGTTVPEFIALLEQPVQGLVIFDGAQQGGTWSLSLTEIKADTPRLGEQCPDLSLEARGTLTVITTGVEVVGTGSFELNSWTVEGWEAQLFSQSAEYADFTGTLNLETGGDDFEEVRFSGGFFGGNDGARSFEMGFSND